MATTAAVHLDLVFYSSEDDCFPAANLQTKCHAAAGVSATTTPAVALQPPRDDHEFPAARGSGEAAAADALQRNCVLSPVLHDGGWESEKFCEYPQELVFQVNRGIPTHIGSVRTSPVGWCMRFHTAQTD